MKFSLDINKYIALEANKLYRPTKNKAFMSNPRHKITESQVKCVMQALEKLINKEMCNEV